MWVHACRHQQIDAVRLSVNVLVDPCQFDVEGFRRVAGGTEYAKSARITDFRDDVSTVAECKQGKFNPQQIANFRIHF